MRLQSVFANIFLNVTCLQAEKQAALLTANVAAFIDRVTKADSDSEYRQLQAQLPVVMETVITASIGLGQREILRENLTAAKINLDNRDKSVKFAIAAQVCTNSSYQFTSNFCPEHIYMYICIRSTKFIFHS